MSIEQIVNQLIENRLTNVHTAIPGEILSYDKATRKASVKPLINREFKDNTILEYPVITNCPVVFPGTAQGVLHFDLTNGDGCLIVFSERSLDKWLSSGGVVNPNNRRLHDLSDGVIIPGLYSFNNVAAGESGVVLKNDQIKLKLENNKAALGNSSAELLDLFEQTLTALEVATTLTSIGAQPLVNVATFTSIKTLLAEIKGSL